MRILFCGDIVGRTGRDIVLNTIPELRRKLALDLVIVNGENAAHGYGINRGICQDLYKAGVDIISGGNHSWDQRDIISYIDQDKRLLRPLNYPATTPGRGFTTVQDQKGRTVLVANVMGRLFMDPLDDPFSAIDNLLKKYPLGSAAQAIVVDIHAEATSEKMAMGHFCDGKVSLVIGTHTHVPTADAQILPGGTAFQSDAGMCGDYNSIIGMSKEAPLNRFTKKMPGDRILPAEGPGTLCGTFVETDDTTGLAKLIAPVRVGPRLQETLPILEDIN